VAFALAATAAIMGGCRGDQEPVANRVPLYVLAEVSSSEKQRTYEAFLVEIDLTTLRLTCSSRPARIISGNDLFEGFMWDGAGAFLTGADMKQTRCVRVYPDRTLRGYWGERGISIVTEKDGVATRRDVAIEITGSAGPSYGFAPVLIWGDPSNPKVLVTYDRLIGTPIMSVAQLCLVEPFSDNPEPRLVDSSAVGFRPYMPIVAGDNVYLRTCGVGIMSLSTLKVQPFRQAESLFSERFPDVESGDLYPSLGHYGHVVLVLERDFIWGFDEKTLDVLFELKVDPETRTVTGPANTITVPGSGVMKKSGILAPKS
jgi:hypothetical protein